MLSQLIQSKRKVDVQYPRKVHENIFLLPTEMVLKTEN